MPSVPREAIVAIAMLLVVPALPASTADGDVAIAPPTDRPEPLVLGPASFLQEPPGLDPVEEAVEEERIKRGIQLPEPVPARPARSAGSPALAPLPSEEGYEPHPPIRVVGDVGPTGFILARTPLGEPIYRPGSGVVAGNGTAGDPYVIAGWVTEQITFEETTAHVIVEDNLLRPEADQPDATYQWDGTLGAEVLPFQGGGVVAHYASNVTVRSNHLRQVEFGGIAWHSQDVVFRSNTVTGNNISGVIVSSSQRVLVEDNLLVGNGWWPNPMNEATSQISIFWGRDNTVRNNTMLRGGPNMDGDILLGETTGNLVEDNAIRDTVAGQGILAHHADANVYRNNTVRNTTIGLYLGITENATVEGNDLAGWWKALYLYRGGSHELRANQLDARFDAIEVEGSQGNLIEGHELEGSNAWTDLSLKASPGTIVRSNAFGPGGLHVGDHWRFDLGREALRQAIDDTNTVGGERLVYRFNVTGERISGEVGQALLYDVTDVHLRDVSSGDSGSPIVVEQAENLTFENVTLVNVTRGISIEDAEQVQVVDLHARDTDRALRLRYSRNLTVAESSFEGGGWSAASTYRVDGDVRFENNTFLGDRGDGGLHLIFTPNAVLRGNSFDEAGLSTGGSTVAERVPDADPSNTVNGRALLAVRDINDTIVLGDWGQVLLGNATNVTVRGLVVDNTTSGIAVHQGRNVTLVGNTVVDSRWGLRMHGVHGARLVDNLLERDTTGIVTFGLREATIARNLVNRSIGDGLYQSTGTDVVVHDNRILSPGSEGYDTFWAGPTEFHNNTVANASDDGLALYYSNDVRVLYNEIRDSGDDAITMEFDDGYEIHQNNIHGSSGWGIRTPDGRVSADATRNWWGCPDGPDAPACDGVRGEDVETEPWLTQPNADAGADT